MKKVFSLVLVLLGMLFIGTSCGNSKPIVAVVQYVTHTSLNEITDTVVSTLKESKVKDADGNLVDFETVYQIKTYNCEGQSNNTAQIMQSLQRKNVACIIPVATPVAVSAMQAFDTTPIVFSAVSDPVGAGLLTNLTNPEGNITGCSDAIQVDLILDKALEITPNIKNIGFIYNPAETNSLTNKTKIETYCTSHNLTLKCSTISQASEMNDCASSLADKVDAVFITDDNTAASGITRLKEICREKKIPLYCGVESEVRDGGLFTYGINYSLLGQETAYMVRDILNGTAISNISVKVFDSNLKMYLNMDYVNVLNLTISNDILNSSDLVKIND